MAQADIQRAYRQRQRDRNARMRLALMSMLEHLDGNDKALAVKLRAIAEEGLKP